MDRPCKAEWVLSAFSFLNFSGNQLLKEKQILFPLTLLHSEWPKLYRVLVFLSAVGLKKGFVTQGSKQEATSYLPMKRI